MTTFSTFRRETRRFRMTVKNGYYLKIELEAQEPTKQQTPHTEEKNQTWRVIGHCIVARDQSQTITSSNSDLFKAFRVRHVSGIAGTQGKSGLARIGSGATTGESPTG